MTFVYFTHILSLIIFIAVNSYFFKTISHLIANLFLMYNDIFKRSKTQIEKIYKGVILSL
jgi:hypothetical protein